LLQIFAPNKKEEFEKYLQEEMNRTATTFSKALAKVRQEHPELFNHFTFENVKKRIFKP
jgi:predicted mannosyl-3-phosphoglycerate phosphatase (HAD superfamily)